MELAKYILRKRIRHMDFTIISCNCWGSSIYQELGMEYNTPFVGLFFFAPCYLKLLGNLDAYLKSDLTFISTSKYSIANESRVSQSLNYPIGLLDGDVEVHFLHCKSEEEAKEKWYSRRARMNMKNLFIGFDDRDLVEPHHLVEFDNMDFPRKVVFTAHAHPEIKSVVWLKEYNDLPFVKNLFSHRDIYKRHFDVADWLNGGSGRITLPIKIINRLLEVKSEE
jgi:uncharacterized protein (DUF1919 family)